MDVDGQRGQRKFWASFGSPTSTTLALTALSFSTTGSDLTYVMTAAVQQALAGLSLQTRSSTPPVMPSTSPRLPVELQDEVMSHCDLGALALASRVSFGFLQMASPRLYRDVEIVGPEQLRLLFCESVSHLFVLTRSKNRR